MCFATRIFSNQGGGIYLACMGPGCIPAGRMREPRILAPVMVQNFTGQTEENMGFSLQKGEKGGIISPVYAAGPASGVQREGGNSMGSFQSWLDQLNYEKLLELAITLVAAMVCIIPP